MESFRPLISTSQSTRKSKLLASTPVPTSPPDPKGRGHGGGTGSAGSSAGGASEAGGAGRGCCAKTSAGQDSSAAKSARVVSERWHVRVIEPFLNRRARSRAREVRRRGFGP